MISSADSIQMKISKENTRKRYKSEQGKKGRLGTRTRNNHSDVFLIPINPTLEV